jgi:hypothetical protein
MGGFATSAALSAMQYAVDSSQRKAEAKLERQQSQAEAQSQAAQIEQAKAIDQQDRQERLRRSLATQRARFGAQGIAGGGSSEAALVGLAAEADREAEQDDKVSALKMQRVDQQLSYGRSRSLLDETYPRYRTALSAVRQGLSGVSLLNE